MRTAPFLVSFVLVATGAGCGADAADGNGPARQAAEAKAGAPACDDDRIAFTMEASGVNAQANRARAAVVGTVERVGEPRRVDWADGGTAFYGDASLAVERVEFGDAAPGDRVDVRLYGTHGCGIDAYEEHDGRIAPGMRVLVLLSDHEQDFGAGPERVLQLTEGTFTNWRVEVDGHGVEQARNADPRRDAPVRAIVDRLRAERAAGRDPARDAGTTEQPFQPSAAAGR